MKNTDLEHFDSDLLYKSIYDHILNAVLLTSPDGRIFYANEAACTLFGMSENDFSQLGRAGIIDPDDTNLAVLLEERALNGQAKGELTFIKKDGTKFPAEVSSSLFKTSDGESRTCIVIHDLSDIRNVERQLRESEKLFRLYFENGPVGMCVNTPDNHWSEINQEFCRLVGYDKEELLSMNWEQITHPDDIQVNKELVKQISNGEIDHFKLDKRYIHKSGELIYATLYMVTTTSPNKTVNKMIASIVDNTEHNKAVENLIQERQILRTLVDNLPFPIYFIDLDGKKVIANKADLANIGCYDEREVLGKTDEELFQNEVGRRGHADNMTVLQSGIPILDREEYFIDKKGEKRWLQTTKIPLFDSNHQISGLVGIGLDVTQQTVLQQKIKESEAYYKSLVDVSPDGIVVADTSGRIEFVSAKIFKILRAPESVDLIGGNIFSWILPEDLEFAKQSFQNVLHDDIKAPSQMYRCKRYDGSTFWGESSSNLLEDSNGQVRGLMIIFRDISERKRVEEEMMHAKSKAEESDRLKSAFLQNISHEIRTPMNSINGFLEILEDPGFSKSEKKLYANIVNKSGQRLLNTINDIIEVSKIMTSNLETHPTMVNLQSVVEECFEAFKPRMDEKGLAFHLEYGIDQNICLRIDETKLNVVLFKILENAYKFTNDGSVDLIVKQAGDDLIFKVKDTGIGIDPSKLSAIYEPFYQTDYNFNKKHEGAGLGLSISHAYVALFGGKMWIESILDSGTTVNFSIPYHQNHS